MEGRLGLGIVVASAPASCHGWIGGGGCQV